MATGQWGGTFDQRVFRVTVQFQHSGQKCQTGFHLRDVGINTLDPEDVATTAATWATTDFIKILHANDRILGIDAVNLVSNEGHSISPSNVAGVHPSTEAPAFITIPVSMKGSIRKRYGSGRMLWPVPNLGAIQGNQLVDGILPNVNDAVNGLLSRFVGPSITTSMHLVHLHKDLPAAASRPAVPATWYDITSLRINRTVSMLRRRKQGVGS